MASEKIQKVVFPLTTLIIDVISPCNLGMTGHNMEHNLGSGLCSARVCSSAYLQMYSYLFKKVHLQCFLSIMY